MTWATHRSNGIYPACRSLARCATRSTSGAYSRPGRCIAPGWTAITRTTGSLQPRPGHRGKRADNTWARYTLRFHGLTAKEAAAVVRQARAAYGTCVEHPRHAEGGAFMGRVGPEEASATTGVN